MSFVETLALPWSGTAFHHLLSKPKTLSARLSISYFSLAFVLVLISSGVLYYGTILALKSIDDQVLDKRLLTVRSILNSPDLNDGYVAHEMSEDLEGPRRVFMRVLSDVPALQVETPSAPEALAPVNFPSVGDKSIDSFFRDTIRGQDGRTFRAVAARVPLATGWNSPAAVLQVAIDTSRDEEVLSWMRVVIGLLIVTASIVCWYLARSIVNRELRPLRQIASATSNVHVHTLHEHLPVKDLPLELQELASNFNQMLRRLNSACDGLKQYADNIAHELRGPVNKMQLGCEVALRRGRSADEYREVLETNVEEFSKLSQMLQGLLFLARAESDQAVVNAEEIDLASELQKIREYFEATAEESGVDLSMNIENEISLSVDRVLLQRAISNVVTNALQHTKRGGAIEICAVSTESDVVISVKDSGSGIPATELPHVCERFFRIQKVRSASDKHLGLGLPITQSIVKLHSGQLTIGSALGKGTIVTMSLPRTRATSRACMLLGAC